jgi:hypothetical protein
MRTIEGYSDIARSKLNSVLSGDKTVSLTIEVETVGEDNLMEALNLASAFLANEEDRVSITGDTSESIGLPTKTLQNIATTSERFKSISNVISWVAEQKEVKKTYLRTILLPFDYFPGVLVDEINEISLQLFNELSLTEFNDTISVNQEMLVKCLPSLQGIHSFSEVHDI